MFKEKRIIVIGGGLTGLTIAYLLKKRGIPVTILEARERLGGRIHTIYNAGEAPLEMGATWLGQKHTQLLDLLQQLGLEVYNQFMNESAIYDLDGVDPPQLYKLPPDNEPNYRIKGGTSELIKTLASHLDENHLVLGKVVQSITFDLEQFQIKTNSCQYMADMVISTLPPHLLINTINVTPQLPPELIHIARNTHTWMGESTKVGLTYSEPFWKIPGTTGTIFSQKGPLTEAYDHSDAENSFFALKGFLTDEFSNGNKSSRKLEVLKQLNRYYGKKVHEFLSYEECVWSNHSR